MARGDVAGSPLRILFLAPNWLGDVVMSTPLLAWLDVLRESVDAADLRIHIAVRSAWAPLFENDPRVAGVIPVERPGRHAGWGGVWRLARRLRREGFRVALLGPPSLRAALVARLAGIPARVGMRSDGRTALMTHSLPSPRRGSLHYSDELLRLAERVPAALGLASGELPQPNADWKVALPGCDGIEPVVSGTGRPLWVVAPGATFGEAKTWPARNVAGYIEKAIDRVRARIVLVGDAGSRDFVNGLRSEVGRAWGTALEGEANDVVDLTGQTTLREVVAVLKAARTFVGNDSGLMHLAAALGVPTVGVFGSSNPDWTAPLGRAVATVTADGFDCRPCYLRSCNQSRFCLETVSAEQVFGTMEDLLRRTEPGLEEESP